MMIFNFDIEPDLLQSVRDNQGRDRLVVTDRDGLAHQ